LLINSALLSLAAGAAFSKSAFEKKNYRKKLQDMKQHI
jgi:hypothetical protein